MARGTGYPFQDSDATVQPPQAINAEALSNAQSWQRIAAAGRELESSSLDYANREIHQRKVGYLAGAEAEITRKRLELRHQYEDDPEGFDKAWTAYSQGRMSEAEPWAVEHLRRRLGVEGNTAYGQLLSERRTRDRQLDRDRINTVANQASDEVIAAAMGGDLTGERGAAAITRLQGILDSAVSTGLLTQESASTRFNNILSRAEAEVITRDVVGRYRSNRMSGVPDAGQSAVRELEQELLRADNPNIAGLTPQERRAYINRAGAEIGAMEAARRGELRETVERANEYQRAITAGVPRNFEAEENMFASMEAAGGHAESAAFRASILRIPRLQALGQAPLRNQVGTLIDMSRDAGVGLSPEVNSAIEEAAREGGHNPAMMRRFARIESGGDPNAQRGQHRGLFQFSESEWQRYGQGADINDPRANASAYARKLTDEITAFRSAHGREPTPSDLYMVHQQGAAGYAAHLANPTGIAWRNVGRYYSDEEGRRRGFANGDEYARAAIWGNVPQRDRARFPGGVDTVTSEEFVNIWRRRTGEGGQPGMDLPMVTAARQIVQNSAREEWRRIEGQMTEGRFPSMQELGSVTSAAYHLGDDELLENISARLVRFGIADEDRRRPLAAQQEIEGILRSQPHLTPGDAARLADVHRSVVATRNGLNNDPIALTAQRFPERFAVPEPLNLTNRDQARAGLAERVRIAGFASEAFGDPSITVLGAGDRTQIVNAIGGGDAQQVGNAFDVLASVPDEFFASTLKSAELKQAVQAAVRSNDPATFTAAMQGLDRMWARAPQTFNSLFGEDMVKALQDWQGALRYHTPQELQERLRRRDDPQVAERRRHLEQEGRHHANRMTMPDLLAALDPGYFQLEPNAPIDDRTRNAALGDYTRLFVERYAATGDRATAQRQAVERMRLYWGRSEVNSGRLTLYPPESTYQPVNGSHQWMREDLERDLRAMGVDPMTGRRTDETMDPEIGTGALAAPRGYQTTVNDIGVPEIVPGAMPTFTLIADQQTEEEVSNGRPASYRVHVVRTNGEVDVVRNARGNAVRYFWDRGRPLAASRDEYRRERERILGEADAPQAPGQNRGPAAYPRG